MNRGIFHWIAMFFIAKLSQPLVYLILTLSISFAATIDVAQYGAVPGKNVISSINKAITAAKPGDMVYIGKGTWQIGGAAIRLKNGVRFKGAGIGQTTITHVSTAIEHPFFDIDSLYDVSISDLTLDAQNNPRCTHGIDGGNATKISIESVSIENLKQSSEFGCFGIFLNGDAQYCRVSKCQFKNIGIQSEWGAAIYVGQLPSVQPSSHLYITNNLIENTGRGGVLMQNAQFATVRNNKIRGSGKHSDDGLGIELFDGCHYGVIEGNEVDHWISIDSAHHIAIRGNVVKDDPKNGIQFAGIEIAGASSDCVVAENKVGSGNQIGFSVSNEGIKDNFLVTRNEFKSSEAYGAQIQGDVGGGNRLFIHRNSFQDTKASEQSFVGDAGHGFRINGNVSQIVFDNNLFSSNQGSGLQIRSDDFVTSPVDLLTFTSNLIIANKSDAVEIASDLNKAIKHIHWDASNTLANNKVDIPLMQKGFRQQPKRKLTIIMPSKEHLTVGSPIKFDYTSANNSIPAKMLWDLGSGPPTTDNAPEITYKEPGSYSIRLLVWDLAGQATLEELKVEVY